ncbi:MarR family winged helix-turn-helix transcriptional regulator [Bradyrhizobium sp. CIR3A]|uniref:MarR family winged helix-turn-helix transcriptional regulator n=1 Tax=Bradyrhizobium sp. CIR3A TaxID=2663838 RepID=UPI0017BB0B07|nr:MarR family transcriptional regulator [Bradyrhizobium sp. CIR3A]MBB4261350.1 DNA-binding MarR family transcriptional regulator [Bradyrhizobium sp. CIR3A]
MKQMFTDCYCTQLRRASSAFTKLYDEALRPQGLRITQFSMLRGLARLDKATLTELADELALDRTTMSRGVKLLIDAGWVDVAAGQEDGRERILSLSGHGKKKLQDALPAWSKAQAKVEAFMKHYIKPPTSKRLIDVLESLQLKGDRR